MKSGKRVSFPHTDEGIVLRPHELATILCSTSSKSILAYCRAGNFSFFCTISLKKTNIKPMKIFQGVSKAAMCVVE